MRWITALAGFVAALFVVRAARADDETVRVKGGTFYRGEIVESVVGDHVTVKVATGSLRTVAWNDVVRAPYDPPDSPPTFETVRTKDGSVYRGELVERVVQDHVALKLANGAVRVVAWKDVDESAVAEAPPSPVVVETVRLVDGSEYRGEVLERVVGDHVTIRIQTGAIRRVAWADVDLAPTSPRRVPPDTETIRTQAGDAFHGEVLERVVTKHVVLRLPSGDLKTVGWDDLALPPARLQLREDWSVDECRAELARSARLTDGPREPKAQATRYPTGALGSGVVIGAAPTFFMLAAVLSALPPLAITMVIAGTALLGGGLAGAVMSAP